MPYVYVFKTGPNHYKIGRTKNSLEERRKQLSTGNPFDITLFDYIETDYDSLVERYLQKKFYKYRCKTGDSVEHYEIEDEAFLSAGLEEAKTYLSDFLNSKSLAETFKVSQPTNEKIVPNEEIKALFKELCRLRGLKEILEFDCEYYENRLKCLLGDKVEIEGIVSWKQYSMNNFDSKALKEAHPDIYSKFVKETKMRKFILAKVTD